jgi:hypothetical protein
LLSQRIISPRPGAENNFGGYTLLALLIGPFPGLELAFHIHPGAFLERLVCKMGERITENDDPMPVGSLLPLALSIGPSFRGREG